MASADDPIHKGVGAFDGLFVGEQNVEFVEAPGLGQLDDPERKRVSEAVAPFEESRRSAKLRGDLRLYG